MASGIIVLGFYSRTRRVQNVLANWRKLEDKLLRSSFLGYNRTDAVENRDDDDQINCVGKGELRVLGAFGDSFESVGSHDCDCGSGGHVGIKFELDFHCGERYEEPGSARISRYEEEQYWW